MVWYFVYAVAATVNDLIQISERAIALGVVDYLKLERNWHRHILCLVSRKMTFAILCGKYNISFILLFSLFCR